MEKSEYEQFIKDNLVVANKFKDDVWELIDKEYKTKNGNQISRLWKRDKLMEVLRELIDMDG